MKDKDKDKDIEVKIDGENIRKVAEVMYLGTSISIESRTSKEIERRISDILFSIRLRLELFMLLPYIGRGTWKILENSILENFPSPKNMKKI